eukprot:220178_1
MTHLLEYYNYILINHHQQYYYNITNEKEFEYYKWRDKMIRLRNESHLFEFMGPLWQQFAKSVGSSGIGLINRYFTVTKILENKLDNIYDVMVYTRSDFKYICIHSPHPFIYYVHSKNINNSIAWVPQGNDWYGIYDRHLVAKPKLFIKINSVLQRMIIDDSFYDLMSKFKAPTTLLNSEQIIKIHVETSDIWIKRYPPSMFLVRANDTFTRWSNGNYDPKQGLYIKYFEEKYRAQFYCYDATSNMEDFAYVWFPRLFVTPMLFCLLLIAIFYMCSRKNLKAIKYGMIAMFIGLIVVSYVDISYGLYISTH